MSEQGLFRANAVKQQGARLDGEVIVAQPVSSTVLTIHTYDLNDLTQ